MITIEQLQAQLQKHGDSHRDKDITIEDLERAHLDKDGIIDLHLGNPSNNSTV